MLGQLADNFDARQIRRQWLALATALGGCYDLFFNFLVPQFNLVFRFFEQRHLGSRQVDRLLQFSTEQPLPEKCNLFFEQAHPRLHLCKLLLEQFRIIREVVGHEIYAMDYTESGDESRSQNLMRMVTPEVKTIE
ncbi:hypothetical protein AHFPHNDE_01836 [Pseudomonas sp. MM227]|nr:hypothetical protein AHFPHNDE_01836 [Pseudomonas sp. MM227]